MNANSVNRAMTNAIAWGLVVVCAPSLAQENFVYTGTYSGSDNGTITIVEGASGNQNFTSITCELQSQNGQIYSGTGEMSDQPPSEFICAGISPSGVLSVSANFDGNGNNRTPGWVGGWTVMTPSNATPAQGSFRATFDVNSVRPSNEIQNTAALTGLWYDPNYSGSGFNFETSTAGLIITYYSWDSDGNRMWLISDNGPQTITMQTPITLGMSYTADGTFSSPGHSLVEWGTLTLDFTSCTTATALLDGLDGTLNLNLYLLSALANTPGC